MDGTNLINLEYSYTSANVNGMVTANSNISLPTLNLNSQSSSQAMDALTEAYGALKSQLEIYKQTMSTDLSNVVLACETLQSADDTATANVNTYFGPTASATPAFSGYGAPYAAPYSAPTAPYASPYIAPYSGPTGAPFATPYAAPAGAPYATPVSTPSGSPYIAPTPAPTPTPTPTP